MIQCVYDTAIPNLYGFQPRNTPSCPRERAGVLHAARTPEQDRAARRAPTRAGAPHHALAQGCLNNAGEPRVPPRAPSFRGWRSVCRAPAKSSVFAVASKVEALQKTGPVRRGRPRSDPFTATARTNFMAVGEPWVPPWLQAFEAAELLPVRDRGFERPELRTRVVQVVIDHL